MSEETELGLPPGARGSCDDRRNTALALGRSREDKISRASHRRPQVPLPLRKPALPWPLLPEAGAWNPKGPLGTPDSSGSSVTVHGHCFNPPEGLADTKNAGWSHPAAPGLRITMLRILLLQIRSGQASGLCSKFNTAGLRKPCLQGWPLAGVWERGSQESCHPSQIRVCLNQLFKQHGSCRTPTFLLAGGGGYGGVRLACGTSQAEGASRPSPQ